MPSSGEPATKFSAKATSSRQVVSNPAEGPRNLGDRVSRFHHLPGPGAAAGYPVLPGGFPGESS
jgi:hypothetical protein